MKRPIWGRMRVNLKELYGSSNGGRLAGMRLRKFFWWWTLLSLLTLFFSIQTSSQAIEGEQKQVWKRHGSKWEIDKSNGATFTVFGPTSGETQGSAWSTSQLFLSQSGSTSQLSQINLQATGVIEPWVKISLTATRLDWFVRKPGTYAIQGASMSISSNSTVLLDFDGFQNLTNQNNPSQLMATYYAVEQPATPIGLINWVKASDFNSSDRFLIFSEGSPSKTLDLWNMLLVSQSNSSCEYDDEAVITVSVQALTAFVANGEN